MYRPPDLLLYILFTSFAGPPVPVKMVSACMYGRERKNGGSCHSTTGGRGRPPALISPSRFSLAAHSENRAGQLLSQNRAREATQIREA